MKNSGRGTGAIATLAVLLCVAGIVYWAGCEMSNAPTSPQPILANPVTQSPILRNDDGTVFTGIRLDGTEIHPLHGALRTWEVAIRGERIVAPSDPDIGAPNGNFWNLTDAVIAYNLRVQGAQ